ncbi:MAG: hypothetical protein ABW321_07865 [Polyangiales bacterium]
MPALRSPEIDIPARFCGPPSSANGGYTSGLLAEWIDAPCEVTLRSPPPLDTPLTLAREPSGTVVLHHGGDLVAEAVPSAVELTLPEPVSFAEAEAAVRGYVGFARHPYPTCFVCGTERPRGDGLALYPGPLASRPVVAAPWVPTADLCDEHDAVQTRFVWAALDCPSWFGFSSFHSLEVPTLLGRLACAVGRAPRRDEPCVVVGWHLGTEGRRIGCASAIFGADGHCIAHSRSTWVALKPKV